MRPGLDELRKMHDLADPYGVPTGAVPRVVTSGFAQVIGAPVVGGTAHRAMIDSPEFQARVEEMKKGVQADMELAAALLPGRAIHVPPPEQRFKAVLGKPGGVSELPGLGDPLQQAVDNYLLMERKARAWDAMLALYERHDTQVLHLDVVKGLL